jgi:RNA polymerase sigma-70 factor (ECF subfamily)
VTGKSLDDVSLAARIAEGDEAALKTIYQAYGGAVAFVAKKVLLDEGLAEDIVQEVFVSFWNAPERFDPARGSLRTFLVTVAHRRAVDMVRSEEARSRREDSSPPPATAVEVEEEVLSRHQSEQVREAVAALSADERKAISLAYFGGLSYTEVARRLGEPEGTVKSRIRTGMKKLSVRLENRDD